MHCLHSYILQHEQDHSMLFNDNAQELWQCVAVSWNSCNMKMTNIKICDLDGQRLNVFQRRAIIINNEQPCLISHNYCMHRTCPLTTLRRHFSAYLMDTNKVHPYLMDTVTITVRSYTVSSSIAPRESD